MSAEQGTTVPLTVIRGGREAQPEIHDPQFPSQQFRALCAEMALPSDADTLLDPDQRAVYLGTYAWLLTNDLIRPQQATFGPTDLNPLLRRTLQRMEISLSPAFSDPVDKPAERIVPGMRRALIFTARRVVFVTEDHIRESDVTDQFVQGVIQVVKGLKKPQEFSPELRPPTHSVQWAFDVFRTNRIPRVDSN